MKELDYYTVMESKIKYYAGKYDPQNKLGSIPKQPIRQIVIDKNPLPGEKKMHKWKNRFQKALDSAVAIFL